MVDTSSGRKTKPRGLFAPPEPGTSGASKAALVNSREANAKAATVTSQRSATSLEDVWKDKNATKIMQSGGAYHYPTLRDAVQGGITDTLTSLGTRADTAHGIAKPFTELAENVTPLGIFTSAQDASSEFKGGNYLGATAAALGALPGPFGKGAKEVRAATREGQDILQSVPGIGHNRGPRLHDGTVGDINNPDVLFEGKSPHEFTPSQWGRFGEAHGVPNLGPKTDEEFHNSLVPHTTNSGREVTIPGGIDDPTKPFSYYDLLHLKSQAINPNDLKPEVHQAIHDRMTKTMSPNEKMPPHRIFNQLSLAQISPNQPLTPNELAVARTMAKGPEDLERWGNMVPWHHSDTKTPGEHMLNQDGTPMMRDQAIKQGKKIVGYKKVPVTKRKYYNDKIANEMGLGAGEKGGLGARGTADYTRIAETAQRIKEKPEFFHFRGAGEGGKTSAQNWSNYVERLSSQTPGLSAKTGSFGAVWQNPHEANISAVDRHMANLFTEEMFPSKEEFDDFAAKAVGEYNKGAKKKVSTFKEIPDGPRNDAMFGYLNQHPGMKYRDAKGNVNPKVPEHLRPENANWVHEPEHISLISPAYQRVLAANADRANAAGQSTFANQWLLWDRKRNRLEPHEIMFPGLENLPRMSQEQMQTARKELGDAGYFSSNKDPEGDLAPARPMSSASRAGYFALPVGAGVGGAALLNGAPGEGGGQAQAAPAPQVNPALAPAARYSRQPPAPHAGIDSFHQSVVEHAKASGETPLSVLRKIFYGENP